MNNLTIAVIAIAVAQALTMLLIIGREREIKKLRELVTQQRIFISEIKGWLMRERIELAQPRRMKPDREPIADEIKVPENKAPEIKIPEIKAPEIVPENKAPEIVLGNKAPKIKAPKIKAPKIKVPELKVPEPTISPKDATEDQKIKSDREPVADDDMRVPAKTLKELLATVQPHSTEDGTKEDATERLTEAINRLKEDADKARSVIAVQLGNPPETGSTDD
jgi:hypothetical protein